MDKVIKKDLKIFVLLIFLAIILFLTYKIINPFFITIVTAFILAYLTRPLFTFFNKKLSRGLSVFISLIIILTIVLLPLSFVTLNIVSEIKQQVTPSNIDSLTSLISTQNTFLSEKFGLDFTDSIKKMTLFVSSFITDSLSKLPSLLFTIFLLSFAYFYFLYDWEKIIREIKKILPFENKDKRFLQIEKYAHNIVRGSLIIALIEMAVAFVGFKILGINLAFVLSFLIFFLAFIPGIGPGLVWIPLAVYFYLTNSIFNLIGILILGAILTYAIDAIIRTRWLGKTTNVHPLIMLLGILGGINVFGIFGFIIGPIILMLAIDLIQEIVDS